MADVKLRSSGTMVAPHRATMQLSPQGEIAAREGVGLSVDMQTRASKMSDNNARLRIIDMENAGYYPFNYLKWVIDGLSMPG